MNTLEIKNRQKLLENINRIIMSKQAIALAKYSHEKREIDSINETKNIISKYVKNDGVEKWFLSDGTEKPEDRCLWIIPCPKMKTLEDIIDSYVEDINQKVKENDFLIILGDVDTYIEKINCNNILSKEAGELSNLDFRSACANEITHIGVEIFNMKEISRVNTIMIKENSIEWETEQLLPFKQEFKEEQNLTEVMFHPGSPMFSFQAVKNYFKSAVLQSIANIYLYELRARLLVYQTSLQRIQELREETKLLAFKKRQEKVTLEIQSIVTAHKAISQDED